MEREVVINGIEVELTKPFSVVRESLERIGIVNRSKRVINPSCYLLHKRGRYYIIHFKNLLELDGKQTTFDDDDAVRQSTIAKLLERWGLVKIIDATLVEEETCHVFVLPFKDKSDYEIVHKYSIGHGNDK